MRVAMSWSTLGRVRKRDLGAGDAARRRNIDALRTQPLQSAASMVAMTGSGPVK